MVFVHEDEFDHVARGCLDGVRCKHLTSIASHDDLEQTLRQSYSHKKIGIIFTYLMRLPRSRRWRCRILHRRRTLLTLIDNVISDVDDFAISRLTLTSACITIAGIAIPLHVMSLHISQRTSKARRKEK